MSETSLLVHGDVVQFEALFGGDGLLILPSKTSTFVKSKSQNTASSRGITVEGDEKEWILPSCPYTKGAFTIAGNVMCSIKKLDDSHIAKNIQENGKSVLLVGKTFTAEFKVISQAQMPPPSCALDTTLEYIGKGQFVQINDSKASQISG